jgi:hypothetical protein
VGSGEGEAQVDEVAERFPTSGAVNEALRSILGGEHVER